MLVVGKENDQLKNDLSDLRRELESEQSKVQGLLGQLERDGNGHPSVPGGHHQRQRAVQHHPPGAEHGHAD